MLAEENLDGHVLYSLIEGRYKYILRLDPWHGESLFDIEADPLERDNLIGSLPGIAEPLARRVDAYRREAEAARQSRVDPDPVVLSDDEIANLQALGYLQ